MIKVIVPIISVYSASGGRFAWTRPSRFRATGVFMCESEASATGFLCAKAKRQQQDVGHEGVVTGRDAFSLRSHKNSVQGLGSLAFPAGVAALHSYQKCSCFFKKNDL